MRFVTYRQQIVLMTSGKVKTKEVKCIWDGEDGNTYGVIKEKNISYYVRKTKDGFWLQTHKEEKESIDKIIRLKNY